MTFFVHNSAKIITNFVKYKIILLFEKKNSNVIFLLHNSAKFIVNSIPLNYSTELVFFLLILLDSYL